MRGRRARSPNARVDHMDVRTKCIAIGSLSPCQWIGAYLENHVHLFPENPDASRLVSVVRIDISFACADGFLCLFQCSDIAVLLLAVKLFALRFDKSPSSRYFLCRNLDREALEPGSDCNLKAGN